ncbi:hypothetical protein PybrP1_011353 [[Pythium] brassicae (nom. inval.)]|nr:hypothetical protein PybrP1_011353 [[Pythium] brassicae (nom. inval.)]
MKTQYTKRARLTREQQQALYEHHRSNENMTLSKLGEWARSALALPRAPAQSSISELLKRARTNPARLSTKFPLDHASKLLDAELAQWVDRCARRRLCITGDLVRLKAERLRDARLTTALLGDVRGRLKTLNIAPLTELVRSYKWFRLTALPMLCIALTRCSQTFEKRTQDEGPHAGAAYKDHQRAHILRSSAQQGLNSHNESCGSV